MLVDQTTTGVQKEAGPPNRINIEHPLASGTIKGFRLLAKQNRDTCTEVFLHTPRDAFKTLTEGREHAYPLLPGKKGQRNFAGIPTLQAAFMKTQSHDVVKATATLRTKVKGFWVEMRLECGSGELHTPKPPVSPNLIANNARTLEKTQVDT